MASAEVVFKIDLNADDARAKLQAFATGLKTQAASAAESTSSLSSAFSKLGLVIGAGLSVGALVSFGRSAIREFGESEDAANRLSGALRMQGANVAETSAQLRGLAAQLQQTTRYGDDAIVSMQAYALRLGVTSRDMPAFTRAAVDMAAALGMSVQEAGAALAKTLDGTAGRLREVVPALNGVSAAALKGGAALDIVGKAFKGAATEDATTASGALAQLNNAWGEFKERVGEGISSGANMTRTTDGLKGALEAATPAIVAIAQAAGFLASTLSRVVELFTWINSHVNILGRIGEAIGARGGFDMTMESLIGNSREVATQRRAGAAGAEEANAKAERDAQIRMAERAAEIADKNEAREKRIDSILADIAEKKKRAADEAERAAAAVERELAAMSSMIKGDKANPDKGEWAGALKTQGAGQLDIPFDIRGMGDLGDAGGADAARSPEMDLEYVKSQQLEALDLLMQQVDARYQDVTAMNAQREAMVLLSEGQQRAVAMHIKEMEAQQRSITLRKMFANAAGTAAGALIDMAISGEFSAKKLLKATLESISQAAKVEAINQTAKGFALLAAHDPGAGAAFTSAAIYAGVAIAAGVGANAVGGGGGGGGGEGGGASATASERSNANTVERATTPAPQQPGIQLILTGNNITSAGGPQELARTLKAEFDKLLADSNGHASTRRL